MGLSILYVAAREDLVPESMNNNSGGSYPTIPFVGNPPDLDKLREYTNAHASELKIVYLDLEGLEKWYEKCEVGSLMQDKVQLVISDGLVLTPASMART